MMKFRLKWDAGGNPPVMRMASAHAWWQREVRRWIASVFPESKAVQRTAGAKSCFAVHSFAAALRWARLPRKFRRLNACRTADFAVRLAQGRFALTA
jgi:hypothetical protein